MRYLPLTPADRAEMLAAIGAGSIDDLFADVPPAARRAGLVDLPLAQGEIEIERVLSRMAGRMSPPARCRFLSVAVPIAIMCPRRSIT